MVTTVVGSQESTVEVVVGTAYGMTTEIVSGLVEGDQVKIVSTSVRQGTGGTGGGRGQGGGNLQLPGGQMPQGFPAGGTFTMPGGGTFVGGTR
ncbi:MAG: hypothetical protein ACT4QG_15550 [Sporichthyaceae bacterium]